MTNALKTKWITIRANPQNKQQLQDLSMYYSKTQSEILKKLIHDVYQKIMEQNIMDEHNKTHIFFKWSVTTRRLTHDKNRIIYEKINIPTTIKNNINEHH